MPKVWIDGEPFEAKNGERLSALLIRVGKAIPMPCGGRGDCGKCRVTVNGKPALACEYEIRSELEVTRPKKEDIVSLLGGGDERPFRPAAQHSPGGTSLALDIGTTTLALAAVSLNEGRIVRAVTRANPQRAFGADVMNRIGYCRVHGPERLQTALLQTVREMLRALNAPAAKTLWVAGNTTMLHLFFGVDPAPMGAAPYTPGFLQMKKARGESLGLPGIEEAVSLPGAAAFVGADLTAGLNYVGLPPEGKFRLLIDLGTNAEIVLYARGEALCTAAAAGPCFEGANISCGMAAVPGAICAYSERGCVTVGGAPPAGVCGTGLVDAIAALLKNGAIDESGYMEDDYELAPGVFLTPGDVRQYQLAKSAVCSAVETLAIRRGVGWDQIDKAAISGGFSAGIDIGNAVGTGLLPAGLREKCVPVNNSSLLGTAK